MNARKQILVCITPTSKTGRTRKSPVRGQDDRAGISSSAMSSKYLDATFDIHGGGKDLIFPHHENEIAQSEAFSGKPFVKYWLHNGFLSINQEKMSKSLGNFFTIREVLGKFSSETIRLLMLSTHYRSPLDYSDTRLEEAASALKRFYNTFSDVRELQALIRPGVVSASIKPEKLAQAAELPTQLELLSRKFEEAMDDDFNTAGALARAAIGTLFDMLKRSMPPYACSLLFERCCRSKYDHDRERH